MAKLRHFSAFFIFLVFIGSALADIKTSDDDFSCNSDSITQFELDQALDDASEQPFHIHCSSCRGQKKSFKDGKRQQSAHFPFLLYGSLSIKQKNKAKILKQAKYTLPLFSKYLVQIKTKSTLF